MIIKKKAIICDLDGTLAHNNEYQISLALAHNWEAYGTARLTTGVATKGPKSAEGRTAELQ